MAILVPSTALWALTLTRVWPATSTLSKLCAESEGSVRMSTFIRMPLNVNGSSHMHSEFVELDGDRKRVIKSCLFNKMLESNVRAMHALLLYVS